MATKSKFQAIRGTRDLLPPETALWNRVEETARQVFGTFGFGEIRPPILEPTELFARAVGGSFSQLRGIVDGGWGVRGGGLSGCLDAWQRQIMGKSETICNNFVIGACLPIEMTPTSII